MVIQKNSHFQDFFSKVAAFFVVSGRLCARFFSKEAGRELGHFLIDSSEVPR